MLTSQLMMLGAPRQTVLRIKFSKNDIYAGKDYIYVIIICIDFLSNKSLQEAKFTGDRHIENYLWGIPLSILSPVATTRM